ncbi:MAG: murein biosynthesis integral membrane protein MurJ [Candidatus Moranbacteria bacterium CG10_big_fil_rev_8_21_14_0_10_35_21]|nr:MAG: murein biosynthesis integral membrane protein MurJ [Candidatus Moranbacteria bacterium CG10_big_fil_rev_8_21_14_0_10_35_21]PJA88674.1 MAG: murein biosynthesis integral membrane protein MurJ [Candidatus Moranbacteria bacterium CG_4_9_14_3_um_filter_36_9]
MIKRILNKSLLLNSRPSQSVTSAAFVITTFGIISRILGLLRDRFLASSFGAGDVLDAYYAAFRIPDLIYNLLILGALSAAFIPVFTGLISKKQDEEAWSLANNVLNIFIFLIVIISIFFAIFAPYVMKLLTPGFSGEKMETVVSLTRIMFLSPLFLGISGIFGGVLTSFKHFLVYSIAPIFYNIGIIIGVLFFVKFLGIDGLAWGIVLGAFLHMLIQIPTARKLGFKYKFSLWKSFKDKNVKKIFTLMLPRTMGIAVNQINLLIITIFASLLSAGSLTVFNFAQNLQSVPLGLFGISFSIAVFPVLSGFYASGKNKEFSLAVSNTLKKILFFVIPISVFLILLRAQFVRAILGAGEFDWEDTILTFQALGIFSISLFAQCTTPLFARAFYAMHNTKTPFYVAIFSEIINILAVIILINKFEVLGLVMAFSLTSIVQMLLLFFILRKKLDNFDDLNTAKSIIKILAGAIFAGILIQLAKDQVALFADLDTFFGIATQLFLSLTLGTIVFAAMSYLLDIKEFFIFKNSLSRRIFRAQKIPADDPTEISGI